MIRTISINDDCELIKDLPIAELIKKKNFWFWVDFNCPTEEELDFLNDPLNFHPLAIDDCLHILQRPKLDYYEDYTFFVAQAINPTTFSREEVDIFLGENYIITFHHEPSPEIDAVWERVGHSKNLDKWEPTLVLYHVMDKIVDNYFPLVYQVEDTLDEINVNSRKRSMESLLKKLFEARQDLLSLRHTVSPMRDLTYRMIKSQRLTGIQGKMEYFSDIHDHLLKLVEMLEACRELTADMRDGYISLNSHQTNRVMKVLTVITTIFMPLTFIAGIYGMNFDYMPELKWKYGYFQTLFVMFAVGMGMFLWFRKKGLFK
ncbi:magnesium/cobalt transporter CorA [Bacillus sp. DJP31]|uniref:magnesium/cobalt transporter CorA n=1 Tax=Bacillus sp. DJP31 TaxID=3409789 RepID=UPI003BB70FD9